MSLAVLTRVEVCKLDDLPVGLGRAFTVGEQSIAVFRTRTGRLFAVDGHCPHKGGPLADGMLGTDDQVVCPYHSYRYDPASGTCDQADQCGVTTYPVEVRNGGVVVTV